MKRHPPLGQPLAGPGGVAVQGSMAQHGVEHPLRAAAGPFLAIATRLPPLHDAVTMQVHADYKVELVEHAEDKRLFSGEDPKLRLF